MSVKRHLAIRHDWQAVVASSKSEIELLRGSRVDRFDGLAIMHRRRFIQQNFPIGSIRLLPHRVEAFDMKKLGPSTRSIHDAVARTGNGRAIIPPLVANAAFAYDDIDIWKGAALSGGQQYIYSRNSNPTTDLFEAKMASLEGAEVATSFATGMAAISSTLMALLRPGQKVVTVKDAYGGSYLLFSQILPQFGIECVICDTEDASGIDDAIQAGCDLVYLETPTNPVIKIVDICRHAEVAKANGAITVVDNTFATPLNQNPLALGADLVLHSATKFIGGHGDVLGGVVCGNRELVGKVYGFREIMGPALDSNSAWLLLRSIKTLGLRISRQNDNAVRLAHYLESRNEVSQVWYPGLASNPGHETACRQMKGFGGVLSFELHGGLEAVERFLPRLKLAYMAANLGQVDTVVGTPALTSHVECTPEERAAAGIPEGLVRYSVGAEDPEDLERDIDQALKA